MKSCADRNMAPGGYQHLCLYGKVGLCIIGLLPECRGERSEFWSCSLLPYLSLSIISIPLSTHFPSIILLFHSIIHYSFLSYIYIVTLCEPAFFQRLFHLRRMTDWWTFPIKCSVFIYLFFTAGLRLDVGTLFMNMFLVVVYFLANSGTHTATSVIVWQYNLTDCRCGSTPAHTHCACFRVQICASSTSAAWALAAALAACSKPGQMASSTREHMAPHDRALRTSASSLNYWGIWNMESTPLKLTLQCS